ncbi:MAG TPA: hypothetical protein VM345_14240 [Acidimicrobiales bacterium]|jgi:hypothetical protein|nr:hypothetical protein [Acidimicrobiales bacterium]
MPMRENCKHFQSRTYASGETARFCVLDLAPEAPWRCPDECPRFTRRLADVGWTVGSAIRPPVPDEPEIIELNDDAAALLDEAEDILNQVGPEILAEHKREQAKREAAENSLLGKLKKRFRR